MSLLRSIHLRIVGDLLYQSAVSAFAVSARAISAFDVRHYFLGEQPHRVHRLVHLNPRQLHPADKIVHSDLALIAFDLAHAMVGAANNETFAMTLESHRGRVVDQLAVIVAQRPHASPLAVHSTVDMHHAVARLLLGLLRGRRAKDLADDRDAGGMLAELPQVLAVDSEVLLELGDMMARRGDQRVGPLCGAAQAGPRRGADPDRRPR